MRLLLVGDAGQDDRVTAFMPRARAQIAATQAMAPMVFLLVAWTAAHGPAWCKTRSIARPGNRSSTLLPGTY